VTLLDHHKLAVIHITVKELGLSEAEYRDTLEKVAGVRSSRDLDEAGFRKLMRYFVRSRHYRESANHLTLRQKLYIRHLVDDLGWDANHFTNFLHKYYHVDRVEQLGRREASKLIESLKHIITGRLGRPA
jgi:phage gp16-like protein